MLDQFRASIYKDCLDAAANQTHVIEQLANKKVAVTGGTGFLGSWLAETIMVLNTEFDANITLDVFSRDVDKWQNKYPHFLSNKAINCISHDIRSPFAFSSNTAFIIHAAGSPSSRFHVSDPLGSIKTILGIENVLQAASKLNNLERFVNVSSCFVAGKHNHGNDNGLKESDCFPVTSGALDSVYGDAKRMAETLCSIYRSSYRLPISTVRPFAFTGPYQSLQNPWAINNFINDVVNKNDIRIHGDGGAKRSYLYGSDAAFWTLASLIRGKDGGIYNLGGSHPITHIFLANIIKKKSPNLVKVLQNTLFSEVKKGDDLYPNVDNTTSALGVKETRTIEQSIEQTLSWFLEK
jgi:nucleoside-diphosphate-sugar epimerase